MTAEMSNKKEIEKIDVFKHFIKECIEDSDSSYFKSISNVIKNSIEILNGKKNIADIKENAFIYVEFLINHTEFLKKFDINNLNVESIKPHLEELATIFDNWKSSIDLLKESKEKYTRLYAEFDNYKKRVIKEKQEIIQNFKVSTNKEIISIIDDLNIAKVNIPNEYKGGIDIIFNKFEQYLNKNGIKKVEINKGDKFSPDNSECIATIASTDLQDGQIIDILKSAWSIEGKIAQFAQVVVCKN